MNNRGIVPIIVALGIAAAMWFGVFIGGHCGHEEGTWHVKCFSHPLHCIDK